MECQDDDSNGPDRVVELLVDGAGPAFTSAQPSREAKTAGMPLDNDADDRMTKDACRRVGSQGNKRG